MEQFWFPLWQNDEDDHNCDLDLDEVLDIESTRARRHFLQVCVRSFVLHFLFDVSEALSVALFVRVFGFCYVCRRRFDNVKGKNKNIGSSSSFRNFRCGLLQYSRKRSILVYYLNTEHFGFHGHSLVSGSDAFVWNWEMLDTRLFSYNLDFSEATLWQEYDDKVEICFFEINTCYLPGLFVICVDLCKNCY